MFFKKEVQLFFFIVFPLLFLHQESKVFDIFYLEATLQKLFNKLRDNYRRCIRKREQATRSGAGQKKLPTCDFFAELSFLHDVVSGKPTEILICLHHLDLP